MRCTKPARQNTGNLGALPKKFQGFPWLKPRKANLPTARHSLSCRLEGFKKGRWAKKEGTMLYKRDENMGAPLEIRRATVLGKIQDKKNEVSSTWVTINGGLTWAGSDAMFDLGWLEKGVRSAKTLRRLEKFLVWARKYTHVEYGLFDDILRAFFDTMPVRSNHRPPVNA
jgi:hypothetical protein